MIRLLTRQAQLSISLIPLLLASLLVSFNATANTSKAPDSTNPSYVIHNALKKITTFSSNSDKVSPVKLRGFIENEIIPHFDFNNMSHWITACVKLFYLLWQNTSAASMQRIPGSNFTLSDIADLQKHL